MKNIKLILVAILLLILTTTLYAGEGDAYEPESITTETDAVVMLYLKGIDVGFTALKTNNAEKIEMKSTNNKKMKIVEFTSINLLEAIDADGKVLVYKLTKYELKESSKKKVNKILKSGKVDFRSIMNKINSKDLSTENEGSDNPPDPDKFVKLRRVFVYNFLIEDSEGKQSKLQIYVETFQNSSEL